MTKVKICGITNLEDGAKACEYGADLLGFIFVEGTPREIDPDTACCIVQELRKKYSHVGMVGLFKDAEIEDVVRIVSHCDLDYIQLHGSEAPDYCGELRKKLMDFGGPVQHKIIKVVKVKDKIDKTDIEGYDPVDYFVFDTFHPEISGGTGKSFDWKVLNQYGLDKEFFIAGGLNPGNVLEAVGTARPYGVDVSSGVERSPGKKDENLLKEFIENAKKA
ncbi:MAG: N-(5'-phosphoribosyl)anthranilate isomerase [Candidatus Omnitrophota bacterium]